MRRSEEITTPVEPLSPTNRANGKVAWLRPLAKAFGIARRYPVIPAFILCLLIFVAIFGDWLAPHDPLKINLRNRHDPPFFLTGGSTEFLLGTDALGRDVLSKVIDGARVAVLVVVAAMGTGVLVGTTLGLITGYFGGIVDDIIMRFVDAWNILPQLLIILVIALTFGQSLEVLIIVLALISWPGAVRLVRAETLSLKNREYVALAKVAGASDTRIVIRHILPGVVNIVIVTATLSTGNIILTEAALSYLGAGIPPPDPSWGRMISEERQYIDAAWWTSFFPGMVIAMVVMSGNFLGDWFRDRLDPTLRQL